MLPFAPHNINHETAANDIGHLLILEDALSFSTNLGKHSLFVWLFVSSLKTGTGRNIHLDELYSVVRRLSRTPEDSSTRRIMRLVPIFICLFIYYYSFIFLFTLHYCFSYAILETNNEYLPKVVQTDNASSSIKTAIVTIFLSSHAGFQIVSG